MALKKEFMAALKFFIDKTLPVSHNPALLLEDNRQRIHSPKREKILPPPSPYRVRRLASRRPHRSAPTRGRLQFRAHSLFRKIALRSRSKRRRNERCLAEEILGPIR